MIKRIPKLIRIRQVRRANGKIVKSASSINIRMITISSKTKKFEICSRMKTLPDFFQDDDEL